MKTSQLCHRPYILLNLIDTHRTGDAPDVVSASKKDDYLGPEIKHVLLEPHQHLLCALSCDSAIGIIAAWEVTVKRPTVRNGIT